jgi:hypothetical protein
MLYWNKYSYLQFLIQSLSLGSREKGSFIVLFILYCQLLKELNEYNHRSPIQPLCSQSGQVKNLKDQKFFLQNQTR